MRARWFTSISLVLAVAFGAALASCGGDSTGPSGVGTAVNETLVLSVVALFAVDVVLTAIGVRFGTGH